MSLVASAVTAQTSTDNVALTTGSFTPVANDLLVVFVGVSGQTAGALTDSQGLGWTLVDTALKNTSADALLCYVANALAAASSMTVTFTPNGGPTSTAVAISVFAISGMSNTGSSAILQSAKQQNQGAGGTPTITLSQAATVSNPVIGCVCNSSGTAPTTPRGWNLVGDINAVTPVTRVAPIVVSGGLNASSVTWAGTSSQAFSTIMVELAAPSSGGGAAPNAISYQGQDGVMAA